MQSLCIYNSIKLFSLYVVFLMVIVVLSLAVWDGLLLCWMLQFVCALTFGAVKKCVEIEFNELDSNIE